MLLNRVRQCLRLPPCNPNGPTNTSIYHHTNLSPVRASATPEAKGPSRVPVLEEPTIRVTLPQPLSAGTLPSQPYSEKQSVGPKSGAAVKEMPQGDPPASAITTLPTQRLLPLVPQFTSRQEPGTESPGWWC